MFQNLKIKKIVTGLASFFNLPSLIGSGSG